MKDWCKHKFGYVNFDDEFMYFTSTGNWSDTEDLGEFKEEGSRKSSSAERFKTISYMAIAAIGLVCFLWALGFHSFSFSAIIGISWLAYSTYQYMSTGLTGEFKIPYSKIKRMKLYDNTVEIGFLDYTETEQLQEIRLNNKGMDLLLEVKGMIKEKRRMKDSKITR